MSGALNNIYNNVSFALYQHAEAMTRLQEQASTGSRVNRASDDPSAAYQILGFNSQDRSLENYINSLSNVNSTLELSSTVLENMVSALTETKLRATQLSSGIYNEQTRKSTAAGINDILEQMVSLANTKYTGQYLFGGGDTTSQPYVVERTDGKITRVTYQGSLDNRDAEVAPGVQSSPFYIGDNIFHSDSRTAPVFLGSTGAKAGTGTSNVNGSAWLTVTYNESTSQYEISIDDGATKVAVPVGGDTNQAVADSRTGQILYVDTTEIKSTGVELVRVPGTYDVFSTLITIRDILENQNGLSEAQLQECMNSSLSSLEEVNSLLLQTQVSVGSKLGFLGNLKDSLNNLKYNVEDETTRLQEADIAQISIDLSQRQVLYQMSLSVAAKIMSMSLLDFIK